MKKQICLFMAMAMGWGLAAWGQLITNYLPKTYNNSPEHVNSQLFDNGMNVGIGTTLPQEKFDVASGNIRTAGRFISMQPPGTEPLTVLSDTKVNNLNADLLDGWHASDFASAIHQHSDMVSGNGAAGRVTFWSNSSILAGSSMLFWLDDLERLGIGTSAPEAQMHIYNCAGNAGILLHESHLSLHGTNVNTRWNMNNEQGHLKFNWVMNGNTVNVLKIIGGAQNGTLEVNGSLKTGRIFMSQGATSGYVMTCMPNGQAVWKSAQSITGWEVSGSRVFKTTGSASIGTDAGHGKLNIATEGTPGIILEASLPAGAYGYGFLSKVNTPNVKVLAVENNGTEKMVLWGDGRLQIDNVIHAAEIEVKVNVWQDAVFDPDYPLMSLEELRSYIQKNKHLPDVPDEATVMRDGIAVGEMNSILLKKVEELTLYILDLEAEIQKLKR